MKKILSKLINSVVISGAVSFGVDKAEAQTFYYPDYYNRQFIFCPLYQPPVYFYPSVCIPNTTKVQPAPKKNELIELVRNSVWTEISESVSEAYEKDDSKKDYISFGEKEYRIVDGDNNEFEGYYYLKLNPRYPKEINVFFSKNQDYRDSVNGYIQFNKDRSIMSLTLPGKIINYKLNRKISDLPVPVPIEK